MRAKNALDLDEFLTERELIAVKRLKNVGCSDSARQGQCACRLRVDALMLINRLIEAREELKLRSNDCVDGN